MGRYINPFTDWGFKYLFGRKVSKDLLIDFLNCLLVNERKIVDLKFLDKEQTPEFAEDRGIIYDIYCQTDTGEYIIVEMQNRGQKFFKERALFYLSRAVVSQGEKGNLWQYDIKAVYGVFFLNFRMSSSQENFRTDVILSNRDTGEQFSDKMRMIFLELPKFTETKEECDTDFKRWIFILKHMEALERLPFTSQKELFHKLEEMAEIARIGHKEREKYEESLKVFRDNNATIDWAIESGRAEGMEKGIEKGRTEGEKTGREDERRRVALNLLRIGISPNQIQSATGLSASDIEKLSQAPDK